MTDRFISPLRYPGGKGVLAKFMRLMVDQNNLRGGQYVELYAGGAAIALDLLLTGYMAEVYINDISKPLMAFWTAVINETEALCQLIQNVDVTLAEWDRQQLVQDTPNEYTPLQFGFSTFFLNRTNHSGILDGGVIGGREQAGKYKLSARFAKDKLIARINRIATKAEHIHLSNLNAEEFIRTTLLDLPENTLVYLDPPYFKQGQELYEDYYKEEDHKRIAQTVATINKPWIVSYDGCKEILDIYKGHRKVEYHIKYSANQRIDGSEVIFFSPNLRYPENVNPTAITPQDQTARLL